MANLLQRAGIRPIESHRDLDLAQASKVLRAHGISLTYLVHAKEIPIRIPGTPDAQYHFQHMDLDVYAKALCGVYKQQPRCSATRDPQSSSDYGEVPGKESRMKFKCKLDENSQLCE